MAAGSTPAILSNVHVAYFFKLKINFIMETQVKEKTNVNEVGLQKIEKYLETVSKHLFLTEKEKFFKAFPVTNNGKLYYVTLEFDGIGTNFIHISDVDYYEKNYGNCAKSVISDILFPQYYNKKTSIPNFKTMKEKVAEIKKLIEEKFDGNNKQKVQEEVKKMLGGLIIKKKEV